MELRILCRLELLGPLRGSRFSTKYGLLESAMGGDLISGDGCPWSTVDRLYHTYHTRTMHPVGTYISMLFPSHLLLIQHPFNKFGLPLPSPPIRSSPRPSTSYLALHHGSPSFPPSSFPVLSPTAPSTNTPFPPSIVANSPL